MSIWSALYPYPAADGGAQVFLFFVLILLFMALCVSQELMLLVRAERAMWVVRGLWRRETTRHRRQVEEVTLLLSESCPVLSPGARALRDASVETNDTVVLIRPASGLFSPGVLRQSYGVVFLPVSFLAAAPAMLVFVGLVGTSLVTINGLQVPDATLASVLGTSLRASAWGLLAGGLLFGLSRFAQGRAESAIQSIIRWADQELGVGSIGRSSVDRVLRSTAQQSNQTLTALLEHQRTAAEAQQAALTGLSEALQGRPSLASTLEATVERTAVTATLDPAILDTLVDRLSDSVSASLTAGLQSLPAPAPAPAALPSSRQPRAEPPGLFDAPDPLAPVHPDLSAEPPWLDGMVERLVKGLSGTLARLPSEHADVVSAEVSALVYEMRAVNAELQRTTRRLSDAGSPISTASASFLSASERLEGIIPDVRAAAEAYSQARGALDQSAIVLREGMGGYAEASHTLQEMVRDLRESHRSYRVSHDSWDESIRGVRRLIDDLGSATREIRSGASQLNAVVQPAASAADSFRVASEQLGAVLPSIQGAADSYARARGALDQSSETLRQGTQAYARAGADVRALVTSLTEVQAAQGKMMAGWRGELSSVQQIIQQVRSASENLRASAETAAKTASSASGRTEAMLTAATAAATAAITEAASGAGAVIQPAAQAAGSFLAASERLEQLLPRMEGAAQAYLGSQQALEEVAITVQQSTKGYQDAGAVVSQMLVSLRDSHAEAVRRIRDGVDEALLGSLREAGSQLDQFNQQQHSNFTLWDNATVRLQSVLDNLGETADHLSTIADNVESTTGASILSSEAFQHAAASLTELMPGLQATTRSHGQIQKSLEAASQTFQTGMSGYQGVVDAAVEKLDQGAQGYVEAGAALQRMVSALEAQHATALEAAMKSLDESFTSPLRETGAQLAGISANQASALSAWQQLVGDLQSTMLALQSGTQDATQMADRFKAAADPAADAASSFLEASRRLTGLFPRLAESADGYTRINEALAAAAMELTSSSTQYRTAGEQIGQVTRELQKTLKYQVLGTQKFSESMDRAAGFVEAIGPASERVERAADGLRSASERTAEVVQTIQDSVSTQDEAMTQMRTTAQMVLQAMQRQSSQWGNFLGELDRLQGTLNTSVDALATKLPHSIDHTLVHFDAALGEGVARLGGAIERLREAMDDLQERLEMVMSDSGRRR